MRPYITTGSVKQDGVDDRKYNVANAIAIELVLAPIMPIRIEINEHFGRNMDNLSDLCVSEGRW